MKVKIEIHPKSLFGKLSFLKEQAKVSSAFRNLLNAMIVLDTDYMKNKVLIMAEAWERIMKKVVPEEKAVELSKERVRKAYQELKEITG